MSFRGSPVIAITPDITSINGLERTMATRTYAAAITKAGGVPMIVTPDPEHIDAQLEMFDGFVFTGGDDPATEPFGEPTHPAVARLHPDRQAFETELLRRLEAEAPDTPALGVCLGMQMMGLVAGGAIDQHMPETTPTHADHWENEHDVRPVAGDLLVAASVRSKHKQAISDAGSMRVTRPSMTPLRVSILATCPIVTSFAWVSAMRNSALSWSGWATRARLAPRVTC